MPRVLDPVNNLADRIVAYKIGEVLTNSKGAKSARVENYGQQMIFNLGDRENPVISPFGGTAFNDELNSPQTVEFILDDKQEAHWAAFDKLAIAYLSEHSERLFKKVLTIDQVKDTYKSPVTRKENYPAHLRCKINTTGERHAVHGIPTMIEPTCLHCATCLVCLVSLFRISGSWLASVASC